MRNEHLDSQHIRLDVVGSVFLDSRKGACKALHKSQKGRSRQLPRSRLMRSDPFRLHAFEPGEHLPNLTRIRRFRSGRSVGLELPGKLFGLDDLGEPVHSLGEFEDGAEADLHPAAAEAHGWGQGIEGCRFKVPPDQ